jgi:F0F1-type ATP synthase assembly protein I
MGVVPNKAVAEQVIGNLRLAGFPQDSVSFIVVKPDEADQLDEAAVDQTGKGVKRTLRGVIRGIIVGLVVGLILGYLVHRIPSIGNVLALGILLGLFGGVGVIIGALAGSFSTENNTGQVIERYGMELRTGEAIVAIDAPDADSAKAAEEILNNNGAAKVNSFLATEADVSEVAEELPGVREVKPQV